MILLDWYREWIEIRASLKEPKVCDSCETLKHQLEVSNLEKKQLLNRLLEKPEPIIERTIAPIPVQLPKNIPWNVRRQMLEAEDREKARLMRDAAKPDVAKKDIEELEKALDIAAEHREQQSS